MEHIAGTVVNGEAEWASLLPLADGTKQVVRGLTMKRATAEMPKLNLLPIYNATKKQ